MLQENGHSLGFGDLQNLFSARRFIGERMILVWEFMGDIYSGERFRYSKSCEQIFVDYKSISGRTGTFVLDENTLARNFSLVFLPIHNKNGKEIKY